jgi:hypothetical protein
MTFIRSLVLGAGILVSPVVSADEMVDDPDGYGYAWGDPRLISVIGVGITIGGGVSGFTEESVRDNLDTEANGAWSARATFGTHIPLGLEIGYNGTMVDLQSSANGSASLLGTTLEAAGRFNMLPHFELNPYLFAGLGWTHYDVRDERLVRADSAVRADDDVLVVPMGVGVAYRAMQGITFDARGTFRAAGNSELLTDATGSHPDLHTWEATGNLGYEF